MGVITIARDKIVPYRAFYKVVTLKRPKKLEGGEP
jgi:hypothetical protein